MTCWAFGTPDAFLKIVLRIPKALALRVIIVAKFDSLRPRCSAMAADASLADFVTNPLMIVSTETYSPGRKPNLEGI